MSGTIVDGGTPVGSQVVDRQNAFVVEILLVDEKGAVQGSASTDRDGIFTIEGIQPGKYILSVRKVVLRLQAGSQPSMTGPDEYEDAFSASNSKIEIKIPHQPTYNIGTIDLAKYK